MSDNLEHCSEEKKKLEFNPDSGIKKFLTEISTPKLIAIINECCKTDYPEDSVVDFGRTEYFTILGSLDKKSVRGDLVTTIHDENKTETTNKIVIELQSTKDDTMGFRMFVYSFNVSEEDKTTKTYKFPKGLTLYTTLDLPKEGIDEVNMQIESFRVGSQKFSAKQGDLLTVEFPFINLLAKDYEEFQGSPLEPLKVIYPYRYRKDPELMKTDLIFQEVMENIRDYTINQQGNDRLVVSGLVCEIVIDLVEVCKEKNFKKELEIMTDLNKTTTEIYGEEREAKGEAKGIAKGIAKGEAQGEAKGKLEKSIEIAKKLLEKMDFMEVASITGLTPAQLKQI